MKTAAIVAPFLMPNTLRYVRALSRLPGVRPAVISAHPVDKLPPDLRPLVAGFEQVDDPLDGASLGRGVQRLKARMGGMDRLLGVLEQLQEPVAEARERAGVPGMDLATARNFRDKGQMKAVLRAAGVPCARHRRIESDADAWALVDEVGFPIIIKPVDGLGSRGTWRVRDADMLRSVLAALGPSPKRPLQAEEFVQGSESTCETVTINGESVWHSGTHYLPGPLEVIENPWIQYCVLLPREAEDPHFTSFQPINRQALDALGMQTGMSHMEWFRRRDGSMAVSEVGARPPGVQIMPLMSLAHDMDMVSAWVRLMVLDEFKPAPRQYATGCAFFRGQGAGRKVVAVEGLDKAQAEVGHYVVDRALPRVGQPAADGYEGEGWAIVRADTTEEAKHALLRLVSNVRVRLG